MSDSRYAQSRAHFERARRVIPGGIYGHQSPWLLVDGEFPVFLSEAEGCRVRDPDGNEYIDFLCAYGPMVVGYRNPVVEQAAAAQRSLCNVGNLPAPNMVELAERLVALTPGADWAMFAKNGSDVCTWSLAVARAATGRPLVAMARGTYHGVHGWCNKPGVGFLAAERANMLDFDWNDSAGLEALFDENEDRIAAVILTPFRHEAFEQSVMPADTFLAEVRALCDRHGAAMIIDDIRAGFRLHMGGSTQAWNVTPDVVLYSKAIANGYVLSAMLGADGLREAAERVFVTGTFFTEAVPIAAALATIDEMERSEGIAYMERIGRRLCDGLAERARGAGLAVTISGPPAIPFMTFDSDDGGFDRNRTFAAACARGGVFLHPMHNWFVSTAHGEDDIDESLAVAERGFAAVRAEHGRE